MFRTKYKSLLYYHGVCEEQVASALHSNCSFSPKQSEAVTVGSSQALMTAENTLPLQYQPTVCMNQVC